MLWLLKWLTFTGSKKEQKLLCCSPGPAKPYAKRKQCLRLPLSFVTRAHNCAAFISVEMICANKEGHPSNTLLLFFFPSQNCKWMQLPHLVPAGGVPVPPIRGLLTAGIQHDTGSANSWGWCLINTFSFQTAPPHILLPGRVALQPRSGEGDAGRTQLLKLKLAQVSI